MNYRVIELPPLVLSPNNFYLYYNDDGDIISLTNEKLTEGNFIQVSEKFVIDFVESKKEIKNFKVKISDQVHLEQKDIIVKNNYNFVIVKDFKQAQCTIQIQKSNLKFQLHNFEKTFAVNNKKIYQFFIVKKNNLNFICKEFSCKMSQLIKGIKFPYKFDANSEIVVTSGEFESYGLFYDKKS